MRSYSFPPLPHPWPKNFHVFCVGLHKTGTISLNRIFSRYTSWHNFKRLEMRKIFERYQQGKIPKNQFERYLIQRDDKMWAEVESSGIAYNYVDMLLTLFPSAKYILVLRDCYSWCDSHINQEMNHPETSNSPLDPDIFRKEKILLEHMDVVLDKTLVQWRNCTERVLAACPPEKLLVLQTRHISKSINSIARFVGIPKNNLISDLSYSNQTQKKHYALLKAPYHLLREKFERYCAPLMAKYFPDVTLDDFLSQSEQDKKRFGETSLGLYGSTDNFAPWLQRAEQLLERGDRKQAKKCIEKALLLNPDNGAFRRLHALKKRVELCEGPGMGLDDVMDLTEDLENPDLWLKRAERFICEGDYLSARKSLVQFENIAHNPDSATLHHFAALYIRLRKILLSRSKGQKNAYELSK